MKYQKSIISLIISSMILTISTIPANQITPELNTFSYQNTIQNDLSDKIESIIQLINRSIVECFLKELVSIGPRMTSTYGCQKAGSFIFNTFRQLGLDTQAYYWEGFGNRWHPGFYRSYNIEGTLPSKNPENNEAIVFNAHYDTVEDTIGANDDGSGVVGVLCAAYALSHFQFQAPIRFVTFSGEEIGLLGSTYYAKELYENNEDIIVEFNADMIGVANTKEEGRSMRLSYSEDTHWIINGINYILQTYKDINLQITGTYPFNRDASRGGSDYYPFICYGYESIAFWQATGDPNMHTPQDDLSNVNISYLVNTSRLIAATIAYTADHPDRPIKLEIGSPKKGKLYIQDRMIKTLEDKNTFIFDNIWVYPDISTFNSSIDKLEFYLDEKLEYTKHDIPYVWNLNKISLGTHKLTVIAYDSKGRTSTDQISFFLWNILPNN